MVVTHDFSIIDHLVSKDQVVMNICQLGNAFSTFETLKTVNMVHL